MPRWSLAALPLMMTVVGCGPQPERPASNGTRPRTTGADRIVEVATIVNALKCELARSFAERDYVATLVEGKVGTTLELSNVETGTTAGGGGFGVKPLGISFGPEVNRSKATKRSNVVGLGFSFEVADGGSADAICRGTGEPVEIEGQPFRTLLDGLARQLGEIRKGSPRVQFEDVSYKAGFDVERTQEGKVKLDFAIFSLSGGRTLAREAGQEMKVTFQINQDVVRPTTPALSPP